MRKRTRAFGPKPSYEVPHDDGVRSTDTHTKEFPSWHGLTGASLTMATILIIDDEECIRALLRTTLKRQDMRSRRLPMDASGLSYTARGRQI